MRTPQNVVCPAPLPAPGADTGKVQDAPQGAAIPCNLARLSVEGAKKKIEKILKQRSLSCLFLHVSIHAFS